MFVSLSESENSSFLELELLKWSASLAVLLTNLTAASRLACKSVVWRILIKRNGPQVTVVLQAPISKTVILKFNVSLYYHLSHKYVFVRRFTTNITQYLLKKGMRKTLLVCKNLNTEILMSGRLSCRMIGMSYAYMKLRWKRWFSLIMHKLWFRSPFCCFFLMREEVKSCCIIFGS